MCVNFCVYFVGEGGERVVCVCETEGSTELIQCTCIQKGGRTFEVVVNTSVCFRYHPLSTPILHPFQP